MREDNESTKYTEIKFLLVMYQRPPSIEKSETLWIESILGNLQSIKAYQFSICGGIDLLSFINW